MADKRISQLIERVDIANNDVLPIVASGATTTNKVTISTIQDWMQENLDVGVTSVGITIGTSGTDVSVSGSPITTSGNITINIPTASATNRGLLSAADWSTFNAKQPAGNYVTLDTTQTITAHKTFTASGGQPSITINHSSGAGHALDITKAGNGEGIRVNKTSGSGNAVSVVGTLEATTLVRTGGTSSQFLKADGSVDSSTYVTTDTNQSITGFKSFTNGLSLASAGGTNQPSTFKNIGTLHEGTASLNQIGFNSGNNIYFGKGLNNGGVISWNNSAVRYYTLPDSDGTLALTSQIPANPVGGTGTANQIPKFSATSTLTNSNILDNGTDVSINSRTSITDGSGNFLMVTPNDGTNTRIEGNANRPLLISTGGASLRFAAGGTTPQITLASTGAATFSGALNGTSATFLSGSSSTIGLTVGGAGGSGATRQGQIRFGDAGTVYKIQGGEDYSAFNFMIGSGTPLSLSSTGAATFSSSVTASSTIAQGSGEDGSAGPVMRLTSTNAFAGSRNWAIINTWDNYGDLTFRVSNAKDGNALSAGATRMVILSTGNVGIGTASPGARLEVSSSAFNVANFNSTFGQMAISFANSGTTFSQIGSGVSVCSTAAADDLGFGTAGLNKNIVFATGTGYTERMRITSSGNVGIGVTPSAWSGIVRGFQVGLGASFSANTATSDAYMTSNCYYDGSTWRYIRSGEFALSYDARGGTGDYVWQTAPSGTAGAALTLTERMRITSGGYLKATSDGTYVAVGSGFHELTATANGTDLLLIRHKGTDPYGHEIQFSGASPNNGTNWFQYFSDSTNARFIVRSNGGLQNYQANDGNLSDERVKKDIEPLESYWDKFKEIEIVKFKYKDQTHDDFNIGVIAQQVESVAPEFVDVDGWDVKYEVDEEGNEIVSEEEPLKSIYTADLYHASIKVLQEAMQKIEKLEAEIEALKSQING